jgi:hypothetical protein
LQEEKKPRVMPGPSWNVQKPITDQDWSWPISKSKWGSWVIMSASRSQETEVQQNFTSTHIQSCNKQAEGKLSFHSQLAAA